MQEFILQFFVNFLDNFRCVLCGKVFRFSGDHRYLDTHLRSGHKLTERQIIDGPKIHDKKNGSPEYELVSPNDYQHRRRCQNGKGNSSLPQVVSTPPTIQPIHENNADNQQIIQMYYRKIPNGYTCTFCHRQFIKKSDHILICHISMAHPSLKTTEEAASRATFMGTGTNVSLPHDDNEPDISEYFRRYNSRLQCVLCNLLFANSKHCSSHMDLKHNEIYRSLPLKAPKKFRRVDTLTEREKIERLRKLRYDPSLPNMMLTINYDDSDEDNIICDFYEPFEDKMQCLICDLMIKTKSATFLLKHLRTNHSIFNVDVKTKKMTFDGAPSAKKPKIAETEKMSQDLFANYDSPSLSENDSDFVWNFFTLNGEKLTCMCCGLEFIRKTYSSLIKHLQLMHPSVYSPALERDKSPDLPESLSISMRKKMADMKKPRSFKSERVLTKFLISHGVSYEVTEDPNLHNIQRALNKVTSLDNAAVIDGIIEDCVQDCANSIKIMPDDPLTISAGLLCEGKEVFVALAIHHFDENLDRNNNVILRKLKTSELSVKSIDNLMKELSHEHRFSISQITSIITDPKHIKYFNNFQSTNIFKSFHVCIDDFARAVLRISQFDTSLQSLRVILEKILNDDDMLAKFELLVKAKCAKFDITVSQSSTWFECLEMLAMIVEDEQNFQLISTFSQRWLPDNVLNENSTSHLTILLKILKDINTFAKIASYEDGTISSVIPLVLEMISTLETEHLPIPISAALNTLIDCHLKVFLDSNQSSLYDIAMFMDPRYANSDRIYTHDRWASIELIVKVLISDEGQETARAKNPTVPDAAGIFTREVSRELVVYHNLINSIRPGLQVTDCSLWWTRQRSKLPILFRKAKEFFSVPLCTLDAKYFFGKGGKFSFLNATMSYRQFQNALIVASEQEIFKGRGFYASVVPEFNMNGSPSTSDIKSESPSTHQKAPPLPAKIASFAAIRNNSQQLEDEKCARIRKQNLVLMKQPLDTSRFIRRNRPELDDDLDDYLMIPPPPVLEQMCERPKSVEKPQEPSEIICKIEADEVKKEILDPSEIKKEIEDPDDQPSQQMAGVEVKTEEPDF